eukprot:jgi/Mesen1/7946/ME000422S07098
MGGGKSVGPTHVTRPALLARVTGLVDSPAARHLAAQHGLSVTRVAWEDNARTKGSVWGPCISDMTLVVDRTPMPLVRAPNYADLTWDVPMDAIPLVVGNEQGGGGGTPGGVPGGTPRDPRSVSLREYLRDIQRYTGWGEDLAGGAGVPAGGLLAPARDSHALVSAQAAFLPLPEGEEVDFHVALYNYMTKPAAPAVLAIVATAHGTSAQLVEEGGRQGQLLWFNSAGSRCPFTGLRLRDDRRQRGVPIEGAMTQEERRQNVIVVIQVPLRQPSFSFGFASQPSLFGDSLSSVNGQFEWTKGFGIRGGGGKALGAGAGAGASAFGFSFGASAAAPAAAAGGGGGGMPGAFLGCQVAAPPPAAKADVEPAIIRVGSPQGAFPSLRARPLCARDERFPVRVTIQWYKSTSNGVVDEQAITSIARQMAQARERGDFFGSLVAGAGARYTGRPTEATPGASRPLFPAEPLLPRSPPPPPASAPPPVCFCDVCKVPVFPGQVRYRCSVCPDFDLCEGCEGPHLLGPRHPQSHLLYKLRDLPETYGKHPGVHSQKALVHRGICCDVCGANPIMGIRYRCLDCHDFDMCQACEATCGHADFKHRLLKLFYPPPPSASATPPPLFGS